MTYHMILLIIIFNGILLSLSIILTYHLIPDSLSIQYTSLLSYCSFDFYSSTFHLLKLDFSLLRSPYEVLQLTKAYKAEPA